MAEETDAKKIAPPRAAVYIKKFLAKPTFKGVVMVDISIAYPQVEVAGSPLVTQRINAYYREEARRFYDYASHNLFEQAKKEYLDSFKQNFPFRTFAVTQTVETPYNHAMLLSTYFDQYAFTGGAHGNTVRTSNTWELSDGSLMTLSDFFTDSSYKSVFFEEITSEIKQKIDEGDSAYFDGYVKNVFRYFDESHYYLTEKGFAIFYPLYTIAAYVQGIPVFVVPYELFGDNLKKRLFV